MSAPALAVLMLLLVFTTAISASCTSQTVGNSVLDRDTLVGRLSALDLNSLAPRPGKARDTPVVSNAADLVAVPQRHDTARDSPRFFMYKPNSNQRFWLMQTFGYSGGYEWFGPFVLSEDGNILLEAK